jgi:hypothetical protein
MYRAPLRETMTSGGPNTWRSILAVVVGVLFIIFVTTVVDIVLHVAGVYPPWNQPINDAESALATAYRFLISVWGTYLTCKLAPWKPMKHALILGGIGTVLGALGVLATLGKNLGPAWYPIALAVLALPQCWLGGWIYVRRSKAQ